MKDSSKEVKLEHVNCSCCGSKENEMLFPALSDKMLKGEITFNIIKCKDCGLVYVNPRPEKDSLAFYYPPEYEVFKTKQNVLLKMIKWVLIKKDIIQIRKLTKYRAQKILEVGCGNGYYLAALKKHGFEVKGIEMSDFSASYARNVLDLEVITGAFPERSYPSSSLDVVIMDHVIEHVLNINKTLQEVSTILKENGILIIKTVNVDTLELKLFGKYWGGLDVPRHINIFSEKTLKKVLNENKFKIKNISYSVVPNELCRSIKYFFEDKGSFSFLSKFFDINNPISMGLLTPMSTVLGILGRSGRMKIVAQKIN